MLPATYGKRLGKQMSNESILKRYQELLNAKKLTKGQKQTLLAATELFATQGYDATSTAQIAKLAQVSEATIFKYYSSKEKLLLAIIEPITSELVPSLQAEFFTKVLSENSASLSELITFIVYDRFEFIKDNYQVIRIFVQESLTKPEIRQLVSANFKQALADNQASFKPVLELVGKKHPDYDETVIIRALVGPLLAYFLQRFIMAPDVAYNEKRDLDLIVKQIKSVLA